MMDDEQDTLRDKARRLHDSPRFADSYGLVLLLLVTGLFERALFGDEFYGSLVSLVIFATTTWLALRASQVRRRALRAALILIPVGTVIAIGFMFLGSNETGLIVSAAISSLLVFVAPAVILNRLITHPIVSVNTFFGAVCVYVLIAMFFATAFAIIGAASDGSFFAEITNPTQVDYLYFSFTTITTVGYGDLTAAGTAGRMTAMLEAVFGQLYLITVVALVVQNLGKAGVLRRRHENEDSQEQDG